MKILKKVWSVILYVLTFGYNSYRLYRNEREKILTLYECIENELKMSDRIVASIKDGNIEIKDIVNWVSRNEMERRLKLIQGASGLLDVIKDDVKNWRLNK